MIVTTITTIIDFVATIATILISLRLPVSTITLRLPVLPRARLAQTAALPVFVKNIPPENNAHY